MAHPRDFDGSIPRVVAPASCSVPFNPHMWGGYTGTVNNFPPVQGWQCPVCKAVWAPGICGCMNCNSGRHTVTVTTDGTVPLIVGAGVSPLTVGNNRKESNGKL